MAQSPLPGGEFTLSIASRSEHEWSPAVRSSCVVVTAIEAAAAGAAAMAAPDAPSAAARMSFLAVIESGRSLVPHSSPRATADSGRVVPPWYRLLRPMRPDRPEPWTHRTFWTLTEASTRPACRLGAERSLVQIQSPRLAD